MIGVSSDEITLAPFEKTDEIIKEINANLALLENKLKLKVSSERDRRRIIETLRKAYDGILAGLTTEYMKKFPEITFEEQETVKKWISLFLKDDEQILGILNADSINMYQNFELNSVVPQGKPFLELKNIYLVLTNKRLFFFRTRYGSFHKFKKLRTENGEEIEIGVQNSKYINYVWLDSIVKQSMNFASGMNAYVKFTRANDWGLPLGAILLILGLVLLFVITLLGMIIAGIGVLAIIIALLGKVTITSSPSQVAKESILNIVASTPQNFEISQQDKIARYTPEVLIMAKVTRNTLKEIVQFMKVLSKYI